VTRCNVRELTKGFALWPPGPCPEGQEGEASSDSVEGKLMEFLDGRTHGEELLHALYDGVLDEPIPQRMRALLKRRFRFAVHEGS
jgi:hypothetical protein